MTKPSGLRKDMRVLCNSEVTLSWEDAQNVHRVSRGKCVNASERGLGVLMPDEIPIRTFVSVRVKKLGFTGNGSVRSARRQGLQFLVGLEISGTLRLPRIPADKRVRET